MGQLTIVRFGVDTLECSFEGELTEELVALLEESRAQAREVDRPVPFEPKSIREQWDPAAGFSILPKGRGPYPYVVQRDDLSISLTSSPALPTAYVRLGAFGLASQGVRQYYDAAAWACSALGATATRALSRIDLALDVQGFELTHELVTGFVCPAQKRAEYYGAGRLQTLSFGKRPMMLRAYDKTQQVREQNKPWWFDVWRTNPDFDPSAPVVRIEAEIGRQVLKEIGAPSVEAALDAPGRLLDHSMRWCELWVPSGDQTKARWLVDPRWEQMRQAAFTGEPVRRARLRYALMEDEKVRRRFLGAVATHAARWGFDDYWSAVESLSIDGEQYLEQSGADFAHEVAARRRRL